MSDKASKNPGKYFCGDCNRLNVLSNIDRDGYCVGGHNCWVPTDILKEAIQVIDIEDPNAVPFRMILMPQTKEELFVYHFSRNTMSIGYRYINGSEVEVYLDGQIVGRTVFYRDFVDNNRKYIMLNYTTLFLDKLTQLS